VYEPPAMYCSSLASASPASSMQAVPYSRKVGE
jgi:hypothetical protein